MSMKLGSERFLMLYNLCRYVNRVVKKFIVEGIINVRGPNAIRSCVQFRKRHRWREALVSE